MLLILKESVVTDQYNIDLFCVLSSTSSQLIMDLTESLKAGECFLVGSRRFAGARRDDIAPDYDFL